MAEAPKGLPAASELPKERRTVRWVGDVMDGRILLIDQPKLPTELVYVECSTVEHAAQCIKDMVVRGAPAIGAMGGFAMALAARQVADRPGAEIVKALEEAKATLDAARPTAVNLSWATDRLVQLARIVQEKNINIAERVLQEAETLADQDVEINLAMARFGAAVVPQGANILHHCNTGALATVDIGTAIGVIYECHKQGKNIHVWVDETRPRLQGARLSAFELMREGVPMHLIADSASGLLMLNGKIDIVLYGADRVAANGDVANKIGTYKLSVVARENGIPVYPVVPTSTIDLNVATGAEIPIEERSAEEVTTIRGQRIAPENVQVFNPAFDVTPSKYITGIITEEGICYPPFSVSLRAAKERAEAKIRARQLEA
mmetsp:Transcript_17204/g.49218  ORF Transcript_17204/g.49218 Transcript_17204/m.49218 type:complete len:377 (+) Transcript_17204:118-1248(+)